MSQAARRRSPTSGGAHRVAGVVALALALGAVRPASAGVTADALLNYGRSRVDEADLSNLEQTYTLRFRQQVFQPFSYALELAFNDARGTSETDVLRLSSHGQRLLPRGTMELVLDRAALRFTYDGSLEASSGSITSGDLDSWLQRGTTQVTAKLTESTALSVSAMRTARRDAGGTVDSDEGVVTEALTYTRGGLVVQQQNAVNLTVDHAVQYSRRLYSAGGNARYTGAFGAGALGNVTFGARYGLEYTGGDEESTASGDVLAPRPLDPAAGLYEYDELPTDSAGMPSAPALVDGDLATSSGVALGPDGTSFQNVGVDLGRVDEVDEVQVFVRDANGRPVGVGQVDWTAYTSLDGRVWQQVQSVAAFGPEASVYSVRFTKTETRFVKVVNLGTHVLPAYVTELEVFVHELVDAADRTTRSFLNQSAGLTFDAAPRPWMRLSYAGRGSLARSRYREDPMSRTLDWSQALGSRLGPFHATTFELAYLATRTEATASVRQSETASATATYDPLPPLSLVARTSYTKDAATGFTSDTFSEGLAARIDPYPTLRFHASLDAAQQRRSELDGTLQYVTGAAAVRARLTHALSGSANASGQWSLTPVQPDATLGSPLPTILVFQRYWGDATWTPSATLSLRARVGYVMTQRSGLFQNYYLGWQPLQGGAITFTTAYDTDIDAVDGRWARRASAGAIWEVNLRVRLELTYSQQSLERDVNGVRQDLFSRTVYTTLNARL
jgi:hypothetical protein